MPQNTQDDSSKATPSRYSLPGWFLERNVKTVLDLNATEAQFPICQCEICVKSKDSYDDDEEEEAVEEEESSKTNPNTDSTKPDDQGSTNESATDSPDPHATAEKHETSQEDAISYAKFSELRDAVATNMLWRRMRPQDGTVLFKRCSVAPVTHCDACIMEPVLMNDVVTQVAKSLSMGLISLNYEDLERLGNEFHTQDKEHLVAEKESDKKSKEAASTTDTGAGDSKESEDSGAQKDTKNEAAEEPKEEVKNETTEESEEETNQDSKESPKNESKEDSKECPTEEKKEGTKGESKDEAKEEGKVETTPSMTAPKEPIKDDWKPDWSDGATFTEHYFAARGKKWQDEEKFSYSAWRERAKQSYAAVLGGVSAKSSQASKLKDDPAAKGDVAPAQRGLLIHVVDCDYSNKVFDYRKNRRVLVRLGELVQERRKNGEDITLVISTRNLDVGFKRCRKLCVSDLSTVTLSVVNPSKKGSEARALRRKGEVNTGRLSRVLGALMADGDNARLEVEWMKNSTEDEFARYGQDVWAFDDVHRAAGQVLTRAWNKSHPVITSKHVDVALRKLSLLKSKKDSSDTAKSGESETQSEEVEKDPLEGQFLDDYEEKFRDCVVKPKDLRVSWDDVILDQDTKEVIQNLVPSSKIDVEASSEFLLAQLRIKGCLLYGPPGTGKTHLCRAIAASSGSRMLSIDYAATQSMWVGETEKYIRGAFSLAKRLSPCVLFIDEADALFYRRGSGDKSWERGATTQFLNEMEGLSTSPDSPLVVVATNRPWDLDEAFLRRLPQKFYVGLPDQDARAAILRIFLKDDDLDPAVDIEGIAAATQKFSGSDLRSLCAEAALIWKMEQGRIDALCGGVSPAFQKARKMPKRLRLDVDHFSAAFEKMMPSNSREQSEELEKFHRRYNPVQSELGQGNGGKRYVYNKETRRNEACSVREVISRVVPPVEETTPANMQLVVWQDPDSLVCPLRGANGEASKPPSITICEKFKALIEATFGVSPPTDQGSETSIPKAQSAIVKGREIVSKINAAQMAEGKATIPPEPEVQTENKVASSLFVPDCGVESSEVVEKGGAGEQQEESETNTSDPKVQTNAQISDAASSSSLVSPPVTPPSAATCEVRAGEHAKTDEACQSVTNLEASAKTGDAVSTSSAPSREEVNTSDLVTQRSVDEQTVSNESSEEDVGTQIVEGVQYSDFDIEKAHATPDRQEISLEDTPPSTPGRTTATERTTTESEGPELLGIGPEVTEPHSLKTGADVDLLPLLVTLASMFWYQAPGGFPRS
ncbi:hypothetical protein KVR01_013782 [Diaporthe batatas]|uniref:uncharacterized protein n=1 Tax=Diaporthe batatas TaxID=748121 RepID=UPI001D0380BA|nr:uncharacterized protein KVR01_013782 [Diaporthe batatas]KAG8156330.1 hypothetical protein KVR01_013782 [Diaporthe batatas]